MQTDAAASADAMEADLRAAGTPERAAQEKRYLKSELDFAGASVPQIERVVAEALAARPISDRSELLALVDALWRKPVHERRMAAVAMLAGRAELLLPDDLALVERLVRESRTWALVDGLAADVAGAILVADRGATGAVLDRWSRDDDFWLRRASLLAELRPLRAGAPLEPFLCRAEAMLDDREFFIRKAIGWVLREVGKRRPAAVVGWLAPRTHRASGVTMREAVKYLPPDGAARLMEAYRQNRPAT